MWISLFHTFEAPVFMDFFCFVLFKFGASLYEDIE